MLTRRKVWPLAVPESLTRWIPSVDVYRTREGWLLKFELPGVRPEDVTVKVLGRKVAISGFRRDSVMEEGCSYYSMEISYNQFERTIEMPCDMERARMSLETRDGILLVRMQTEG